RASGCPSAARRPGNGRRHPLQHCRDGWWLGGERDPEGRRAKRRALRQRARGRPGGVPWSAQFTIGVPPEVVADRFVADVLMSLTTSREPRCYEARLREL